LFSVAAALLFFGYRFIRGKQQQRVAQQEGYENAVAIDEDDDMLL